MSIRRFYLVLCVLGLFVPNAALWPWLLSHGFNPQLFVHDLFANGVSAFFGLDVVLSAVTLAGFVLIEGHRINLPRRWLPIVAASLVGVSLGLPLFLYQRHVHLERVTA